MHIITMLALLSILVLVHELGHFGVARALGFKVSRFGFGLPFGPTLYEKKFGDLTLCIHALLLGGYVSFPDDDPDSEIPKDSPDRFANKPVWKRLCVVVAGVTANVIIAYFIVLLVAVGSGKLPSGNYIVSVKDLQQGKQYSAYAAGLKAGDIIASANGSKIETPSQFTNIIQRSKKFDGYVESAKINDYEKQLIAKNPSLNGLNEKTSIPSGIKIILPESTPEKLIVFKGDKITAMYGYKPSGYKLNNNQLKLRDSLEEKNELTADGKVSLFDIASARSDNAHPVDITVLRDGKEVALLPAYPNKEGLLGIRLISDEIKIPSKSFGQSVKLSWNYLSSNTEFMLKGLCMLFTNKIPLSEMHGIVAITKIGGDMIQHKGIWDGLLLTALISMDLAIVNLLPIPALDGGHIVFLLIEKLRGRPLNETIQENIAKVSFAILITLMVLIIFNDIIALFMNKL